MFSKFEENNYCTIAGSGSRFFTSDNLWGVKKRVCFVGGFLVLLIHYSWLIRTCKPPLSTHTWPRRNSSVSS